MAGVHHLSFRSLEGDSVLHRLDPRVRAGVALVLGVTVAVGGRLETAGLALVLGGLLVALGRLPLGPVAVRLLPVNLFALFLWATVPFGTPGDVLFALGPLRYSVAGAWRALEITLGANAIMLFVIALMGTMEIPTLGHALARLGVPKRLVHLLLFMVRYIVLADRELHRMRWALKCRGFRPAADRHTCRTYGYLVGMLLVRALDRAERVMAAMKCRGWCGELPLLDRFRLAGRDGVFLFLSALAFAAFLWLEWKGRGA